MQPDTLPEDRRGRAFGMFGALMTFAAALGPLIGGELVRLFGWPSVFVAEVPVIAVCALLAVLSGLGNDRARAVVEARFDWLGSVLIGVALTVIVVGLRVSAPVAWFSASAAWRCWCRSGSGSAARVTR